MAEELPRKTIMAWRAFTSTTEFREGIEHLKTSHAPSVKGKTALELMEAGLKWGAYFEALNDLIDVLSSVPKENDSAETPGLEN